MKSIKRVLAPPALAMVALALAQNPSPPSQSQLPLPSPQSVLPSLPPAPKPLPTHPVVAQPVAPAGATQEIPQWQGQYRGFPEFTTQVLRTAKSWTDFWKQVDREPPQNFAEKTELAVAVHAGERPTGGYVVKILKTYADKEDLVVVYVVQAPSPDSMVTQAITKPWVAAIVPRTDRNVVFQPSPK